jgi:N-acetylmuramoyl-L-alanine amidase
MRHLTVFLDAGHGGLDPGAVGATQSGRRAYEADETLPIELDTMAILRRQGLRVVVSRTRDSTVARLRPGDVSGNLLTVQGSHRDITARPACADDAGANVLIGIYFNGGAPGGAGSLTGYDAARPFAADNLRLARLLQHDVLSAMNAHGWGIPNAGVVSDVFLGSAVGSAAQAYGHLVLLGPAKPGYLPRPSRMPGAIIEPLFITDPFEATIAASRFGQHVIAAGLANAVEQYFAAITDLVHPCGRSAAASGRARLPGGRRPRGAETRVASQTRDTRLDRACRSTRPAQRRSSKS